MLLTGLVGSFSRSYLMSAFAGWRGVAAASKIPIGNFNHLQELDITDRKAVVILSDLKDLERQLLELGPDALKKFKNQSRKLGHPARDRLRKTFSSVGINGPLGRPRRPGRRYDRMVTNYNYAHLSWERGFVQVNSARGIDVNYKNRNESKALSQLARAQDGTISIVRLLVKAPALIVADMAGKSNKARKNSGYVRPYQTNLFGRGVVEANGAMRQVTPARVEARTKWLQALDRQAHNRRQNKASRYAWPTMERYMVQHKTNVAALLNEVINSTNKKLAE